MDNSFFQYPIHTELELQHPTTAQRRKACDLCSAKKIKCDMIKPICSNCILYRSECKTSIARRPPGRLSRSQPAGYTIDDSRKLEERLTTVETGLRQVLMAANPPVVPPLSLPSSKVAASDKNGDSDDPVLAIISDQTPGPWPVGPIEPRLYDSPQVHSLPLPPRNEIQPVIEQYFQITNTFVPLFSQLSFTKLLDRWYSSPATMGNRAEWAAIQVVLALGLRTAGPESRKPDAAKIQRANAHLNNAQSTLAELLIREEDLLGIQVLLGIIILFQNSSDQRPASVIIASTMRLAHRLCLHSSKSSDQLPPEETLQRSRVFWIAYTLDKELSIRVKTPSIQSDTDIDLSLPPPISPDGGGVIWTLDGRSEINIFRLRVELAHIQGKVYDLLYSNRAATIKGPERQQIITQLEQKLSDWYGRIPSTFSMEHVSSTVGPCGLVPVAKMYFGYLLTEVMTHGLYSGDADWVTHLGLGTRFTIRDVISSQDHFGASRSHDNQSPPSRSGWDKLVEISRGCLKLFHAVAEVECLIWQCSCGHSSALIILLANICLHPSLSYISFDQYLTAKSVNMYNEILDVTHDKAFESLRGIVTELARKANDAVESYELSHGNAANSFHDESADWGMFLPPEEVGYSTFEDGPDSMNEFLEVNPFEEMN